MGAHSLLVCLAFAALLQFVVADPIWKVFCDQTPVFRGRADPIVEPGRLSQHSHKVFGANNFGIGSANASAMEYFNHIRSSSCTSCSISIDLSNYWIPDLYYEWENGSFSLVPNGGMTVYYLSRSGSGNQSNPDFQPFPDGLRMTSGSPVRRSFSGTVKERAISYACLGASGPETPYFPTNESICTGGLRAQVWFPMCWDGVNLDSPNHQSHMSHPIEAPDHGNCPSTHPVRLPGVFFETLFDVNPAKFPHGKGTNPFRWACGDSTGYGLHGDFLNGWDKDAVRAALKDPKCDNNNKDMAFGNNVKACPPLAPYVKDSNNGCYLNPASKVPTIEDLGVGHLMNHMPGCNPVTHGPANAVACKDDPTPVVIPDNFKRVLIKSALNGMYLLSNSSDAPIKASISPDGVVGYSEVFLFAQFGTGWSIMSEGVEKYVTAANSGKVAVIASKGGASGWETFDITQNNDTTVSFVAQSNSKILSQQADGTLLNSATTITTSEKFYLIDANTQKQAVIPNQPLENNPAPDKDYDSSSSQVVATIALVMLGLLAAVL